LWGLERNDNYEIQLYFSAIAYLIAACASQKRQFDQSTSLPEARRGFKTALLPQEVPETLSKSPRLPSFKPFSIPQKVN